MSRPLKWFGVVTLFPEMFTAMQEYGVVGRSIKSGLVSLDTWNPRDFAKDKHRAVDDRPYGGGPGMLMKVQPLQDAIQSAKKFAIEQSGKKARTIYLSPQGARLDHRKVVELTEYDQLICVAGRYEGIDERLIEAEIDEEISIGDFVISGGEIAAMALIDSVSRMTTGVLGHHESAQQDSFVNGLLDCPHYTRPEVFGSDNSEAKRIDGVAEQSVPTVLLSGDHQKIKLWRLKQSLGRTWQRRPDLLDALDMTQEQQLLLQEFIKEANR